MCIRDRPNSNRFVILSISIFSKISLSISIFSKISLSISISIFFQFPYRYFYRYLYSQKKTYRYFVDINIFTKGVDISLIFLKMPIYRQSIFSGLSLSISIFSRMALSISISIFSKMTISILFKSGDISTIDIGYRYIEQGYSPTPPFHLRAIFQSFWAERRHSDKAIVATRSSATCRQSTQLLFGSAVCNTGSVYHHCSVLWGLQYIIVKCPATQYMVLYIPVQCTSFPEWD